MTEETLEQLSEGKKWIESIPTRKRMGLAMALKEAFEEGYNSYETPCCAYNSVEEAWEPIDTAPKDGTSVLIYQPSEQIGKLTLGPVIYVCYYDEKGKWTESDGEMYSTFNPTHWMPLPEPPTEE